MATREQILEAVKDEDWQEYRKAMKGKSTAEKLDMLKMYYDEGYFHFYEKCQAFGMQEACPQSFLHGNDEEWFKWKLRIDNYIKALCRGGQLYAGESLETALMVRPTFTGLRIKR